MTRLRAALALLLPAAALAMLLAGSYRQAQPAALPEVPHARLHCVSYAPFHRPGQTPFDPALTIDRAQIEDDLARLRPLTDCVRTYGLDHGLDQVPAVARAQGMRVLLGAWVGRDSAANEAQLSRALALAHEYRDTVALLIVGNEVLLRREMSPEQLAALLARARRASPVPIAYAEVWEFWLRHRGVIAPQVDVVAAHILPYWEDDPVGVAQAVDHVYEVAARLRAAFGDQPVYIAETGWPAAGRQRGAAQPGALAQARFVRELLARQQHEPLEFNLIEAFDQPWKRALEGAMGGAWGLFDAAGNLRVQLTGEWVADARWLRLPCAAAAGALLGLLLALTPAARGRRPVALLVWVPAGGLLAALALLNGEAVQQWSRNPTEFALRVLHTLTAAACTAAAAWRLARAGAAPGRRGAVDAWRRPPRERLLPALTLAWLFIAATLALGLVFDPRYRPLDWPLLAGPALLLGALALRGDLLLRGAREERLLAAVCAACAPLIAINEGLANDQALAVALALALLALAILAHQRGTEDRASTSAPSSAAGAASAAE